MKFGWCCSCQPPSVIYLPLFSALWKMLISSHRRNLFIKITLKAKKERSTESCLTACSCQDTYQHCLHVSKSFSLSYEPAPLTLQSPSTIHLHVSTTASKENHNLASRSPQRPTTAAGYPEPILFLWPARGTASTVLPTY